MDTTTQKNRLIAEFMGLKVTASLMEANFSEDNNLRHEWDLRYDYDYSSLLMVIRKINDLYNTQYKPLAYHEARSAVWNVLDLPITTPTQEVFEQVVLFIVWYNQNKI